MRLNRAIIGTISGIILLLAVTFVLVAALPGVTHASAYPCGVNAPGTVITFMWDDNPLDDEYEFQLYYPSGALAYYTDVSGDVTSIQMNGFWNDGLTWYWHLLGHDPDNDTWVTLVNCSFVNYPTTKPISAPSQVAPSNGANDAGTSVSFQWSQVSYANNYLLQVAIDPGFTGLVFNNYVGDYIGITLSPMPDNGTIYYWRVAGYNQQGLGPFSSVWGFTNGPSGPPANAPVLTYPSNGANISGTSVALQWGDVDRANDYYIEVAYDIGFTQIAYAEWVGDYIGITLSPMPDDGSVYYWRVKARNSKGESGYSSTWSFTNGPSGPPANAPVLISPTNGANNGGSTVALRWGEVARANDYYIEVAYDSGFTQIAYAEWIGDYIGINLSPMPDDGTIFYWRVKARNSLGETSYSSSWSFTNGPSAPPSSAPSLTSPVNGSNDGGTSVILQWSSVARASDYYIEIAYDASFTQTALAEWVDDYLGIIFTPLPDDGTTYYWRVKAGNALGETGYSPPWSFINGPSSAPAAPVLLSPGNGTNAGGTSITFQWVNSARSSSYHLQVALDPGFTQLVVDDSVGNYSSALYTDFQDDGTTYYWRVAGVNDIGETYSQTWSFVNGPSALPDAPSLILPEMDMNIGGDTVVFSWIEANRASDYRLQIAYDSGFTNLVFNDLIGDYTDQEIYNFPDDGRTYYWRVAGVNSRGETFSDSRSFINGPSDVPDAPVLVSPSEGVYVEGTAISFLWNAVDRASDYNVQITRDDGSPVYDQWIGNITSITVPGFLDDGQIYYWQVTARNAKGEGLPSEMRSFINDAAQQSADSEQGPPNSSPDDSMGPGCGSPVWAVDKVNLNLYVVDTPIWYTPAVGPAVRIQLNYNSRADASIPSPFGKKWSFNYQSYLTVAGNNVTITMPDSRQDVYKWNGSSYTKPFRVFNTLTKTAGYTYRYELRFLDDTVYVYDIPNSSGLSNPSLVEIRDPHDPNNLHLTFGYQNGRLVSITDSLGNTSTINYYSNGLIQNVYLPTSDGRYATFQYDAANELQQTTDMGGYVTSYTYDSGGKSYMSSITDPKVTWLFMIEPNDTYPSPAPYPAPGSGQMGYNYRITIKAKDPSGNPVGQPEEYFYDGLNTWRVSPNDYVPYSNAQTNNLTKAAKTHYYIDRTMTDGLISKIVTPEGRPTVYTYYNSTADKTQPYYGLVKQVQTGDSTIYPAVSYTYNVNGLVATYTDAKGHVTTNQFDPNNNVDILHVLTQFNGQTDTINYTYTAAHDVQTVQDRLGYTTRFDYNGYGQLDTMTEALGTPSERITNYQYDPNKLTLSGIQIGNSTATSPVVAFTFDNKNRLQTETRSDNVLITYDYDNLNQTRTITYPDNKTAVITNSTQCPYIVDSVKDRANRTTTFYHDPLKRLYQKDGPDGTTKYDYDFNSNLTGITDPANHKVSFGYDHDNKLSRKTYPDNSYVSYTYDSAGMLHTFTNARQATATFGYDQNRNLLSIAYSGETPPNVTHSVNYTYDGYDRMWTRDDGIGHWAYTYDSNNNLKSVVGPWTNTTISYDYNERNQLQTMTPQGGTAVGYGYDSLGRLHTITKGTDIYTYDYYDFGSINSSLVQTLTRNTRSYTSYQYNDPLKKLTDITTKKISDQSIIRGFSYSYNNYDLIDTETITNGAQRDPLQEGSITYANNNLNQVTGSNETNPARVYLYDNDGNTTQAYTPDGYRMTLTFDAANRPATAQFIDSQEHVHLTNYYYSGDGLLAQMTKKLDGTLQSDTRFIRAGFLPVQERDSTNTTTREYLWGLNAGGGIGGLLKLTQGGQDYDYVYDGKGNVSAILDGSGNIVASYTYDGFGNMLKKTGTLDQPFQFSTKRYDSDTGLLDYGARTYSSNLGRFLTRDPMGESGDINLYRGMGGNPINLIDSWGLADVYIWNYTGKAGNWGHAALRLNDGTYISWWPEDEPRKYAISSRIPIYSASALPPDYSRDRIGEGRDRGHPEGIDPDSVIHVDNLDEGAILKWWNDFIGTHKWKTLLQNCSTTVAEALTVGGAMPELSLEGTPLIPIVWTPADVERFARANSRRQQ